MLTIRWRRWLTEHYVQRWLGSHTHYGMTLAGGDGADNPDQRIAEDVNRFIERRRRRLWRSTHIRSC